MDNTPHSIPPVIAPPAASDSPTRQLFDRITAEIRKIFVGQDELVLGTLVALFSNGHVLIESVPGLGKTLFVRTLGRTLGCQFGRIQFTADLMPSDITGAPVFNMKTQEFHFLPGPVFTQLLLADEINRSPAKTHAALLEIMQEYRVTVERTSHKIERPFLVMATQNPIESEGTYNLPEAQLDRFMFNVHVDYPNMAEEEEILAQVSVGEEPEVATVLDAPTLRTRIRLVRRIAVSNYVVSYVARLIRSSRPADETAPDFVRGYVQWGAGPRAGQYLILAAKALAALDGRAAVAAEDVKDVAVAVLRHRVAVNFQGAADGVDSVEIIRRLLAGTPEPRAEK